MWYLEYSEKIEIEITDLIGAVDMEYFNKQFKITTGSTMNGYRERIRTMSCS